MDRKLLYWDNLKNLHLITKTLLDEKNPGIIAGSSDTVFGLFAGLFEKSFNKINDIKKRKNKPYLILISSYKKLSKFTQRNNVLQIETLLQLCWPGPLTIIFKAADTVPKFMKGPNNTIALRVPNHTGLQKILRHCDGLFSTSANIVNQPVPTTLDEVDQRILDQVEYIVIDAEEKPDAKPSTILDCSGDTIKVIREGAYPIEQLEKIYGSRFS